jgi:hypothetical protein
VSSSASGCPETPQPRLSVAQLLAAKNARPVQSLDELTADTFESDYELAQFLAFNRSQRHHDQA